MNLFAELERITEPPFCRSKLRTLSADEVAALQAAGQVTPLERISGGHTLGRVSVPERRRFSDHARACINRPRFV